MKCIASFIDKASPAAPDATVSDAAQRFAADPRLRALPVAAKGVVVGLVRRDTIERAAAAGLDHTLLSALMNRRPRLVEATTALQAVLDALLADRAADDAFVVIEDGRALGASD